MVIQYFENPILRGCDALTEHVVPKILKNRRALKSTQHLIEMSTRNISRGVNVASVYSWQPYYLLVLIIWKPGCLNLLEPQRHVQACTYWDCFAFLQGPYNNEKYLPNSASHPISLEPEECHCKNIKSHIQYFLLHKFPWLTYYFLCSMRPWVVYTLLCTGSIFTFPSIMVDRTANYSTSK